MVLRPLFHHRLFPIGLLLSAAFLLTVSLLSFRPVPTAYDFNQVTVIESVIPGGTGRSRMITTGADGTLQETEMKNFFSLTGINFQNVRDNDRAITEKITQMSANGWELVEVTTGVNSAQNSSGIFLTRYLFRRAK